MDLRAAMTEVSSSPPSTDRILAGVALMLGFCLTAPLLDVAAKLASASVPVGQITAARFVVQCALMAPFIWIMGLSLRVARGQWLALVFRAVLLFVATFCFIAAIRVMPLTDALAIVFVAPFVVLLVGKFYLGEDVGPRRVGAAVVGFVGVLFVIQPSFAAFGAVALFPLGTAVGFAFYILVTRGLSRQVHPLTLQFYTGLIASLFCMPVMMLAEGSGSELFDPVWPAGIACLRLLPRCASKAGHNDVPAAPVSQRRAARSWRRVSTWVELSWSVRSALCRAGRSSLLFRIFDRGQFVRSNDVDDPVRIYTGPMISALHPTLAISSWTRTVFRYGITALALLMFLLALRRSG